MNKNDNIPDNQRWVKIEYWITNNPVDNCKCLVTNVGKVFYSKTRENFINLECFSENGYFVRTIEKRLITNWKYLLDDKEEENLNA